MTLRHLAERLEQDRTKPVALLCLNSAVALSDADNELNWAVEYIRVACRNADLPPCAAPDTEQLTPPPTTSILNNAPRWSLPSGNQVVPSPWQATGHSPMAARS